jgi:hypothetical protein
MREPDVVGSEMTSVRLESRIVVGRRLLIGTRRSRLEVATVPEGVALRHLATHVDELAIPGQLPQDSTNSQGLKLLKWSSSSIHRCRWDSRIRDLLFVVHARLLSLSKVAITRQWSLKAYHPVGLNATHRRSVSAGALRRTGNRPESLLLRRTWPSRRQRCSSRKAELLPARVVAVAGTVRPACECSCRRPTERAN